MSTYSVSEFKKKCLSLFKNINKNREPILITKYGAPVAKVIPFEEEEDQKSDNPLMGSVLYEGDLISPIEEGWDSDR